MADCGCGKKRRAGQPSIFVLGVLQQQQIAGHSRSRARIEIHNASGSAGDFVVFAGKNTLQTAGAGGGFTMPPVIFDRRDVGDFVNNDFWALSQNGTNLYVIEIMEQE